MARSLHDALPISDFELSGAGVLQRHVIAACDLNRCDRCPTAKLARIDRGAVVLKFGACSASNGIEEVICADLHQAGRSVNLNHVDWDADRAVAVEVQVEYGLKRL